MSKGLTKKAFCPLILMARNTKLDRKVARYSKIQPIELDKRPMSLKWGPKSPFVAVGVLRFEREPACRKGQFVGMVCCTALCKVALSFLAMCYYGILRR